MCATLFYRSPGAVPLLFADFLAGWLVKRDWSTSEDVAVKHSRMEKIMQNHEQV